MALTTNLVKFVWHSPQATPMIQTPSTVVAFWAQIQKPENMPWEPHKGRAAGMMTTTFTAWDGPMVGGVLETQVFYDYYLDVLQKILSWVWMVMFMDRLFLDLVALLQNKSGWSWIMWTLGRGGLRWPLLTKRQVCWLHRCGSIKMLFYRCIWHWVSVLVAIVSMTQVMATSHGPTMTQNHKGTSTEPGTHGRERGETTALCWWITWKFGHCKVTSTNLCILWYFLQQYNYLSLIVVYFY